MVSGRRRKREWRVVLGAGKQEAAGSNGRTMPSTVPRSKLAFFLCTKRVCMCVCVDNVECNFVKNALSARVCVCVWVWMQLHVCFCCQCSPPHSAYTWCVRSKPTTPSFQAYTIHPPPKHTYTLTHTHVCIHQPIQESSPIHTHTNTHSLQLHFFGRYALIFFRRWCRRRCSCIFVCTYFVFASIPLTHAYDANQAGKKKGLKDLVIPCLAKTNT